MYFERFYVFRFTIFTTKHGLIITYNNNLQLNNKTLNLKQNNNNNNSNVVYINSLNKRLKKMNCALHKTLAL